MKITHIYKCCAQGYKHALQLTKYLRDLGYTVEITSINARSKEGQSLGYDQNIKPTIILSDGVNTITMQAHQSMQIITKLDWINNMATK